MRVAASLRVLVFLLSRTGGDMIRLVPACDEVCKRNSLLATYYPSRPRAKGGVTPVSVIPVKDVRRQKTGGSATKPQVVKIGTIGPGVRSPPTHIEYVSRTSVISKPVAPRPSISSVTVTRVSIPAPAPITVPRTVIQVPVQTVVRIKPSTAAVQPGYLVPVPVHNPLALVPVGSVPIHPPPQGVRPAQGYYIHQPQRYIANVLENQPKNITSSLRMIGKIRKKVNLIYDLLSRFGQKYFQRTESVPRRTLFIAPVVTKTVLHTVSMSTVRPVNTAPPSPPSVTRKTKTPDTSVGPKTVTVTTYVTQTPPVETRTVQPDRRQTMPVIPSVSLPRNHNACTTDVKCTYSAARNPPVPREPRSPRKRENGSSDSSSSSGAGHETVPGRKPYVLRQNNQDEDEESSSREDNSPSKCYLMAGLFRCDGRDAANTHGDFLPKRLDIGDALVYKNDVDDNDRIVYLSDLLRNGRRQPDRF